MLQKIVNGIAIASGVVSLTVIGLGGYVFIRKDAIIENVKGKIMEAVTWWTWRSWWWSTWWSIRLYQRSWVILWHHHEPTEPTAPTLPLGF